MCTRGLHIELPAVLRLLFKQYTRKKQQEKQELQNAAAQRKARLKPSALKMIVYSLSKIDRLPQFFFLAI